MDEIVFYRIDSLLEHIDLVLNDTAGVSMEELAKSSLLLRATCFSIAQIGERMVQLEKTLSKKYPDLPWLDARGMRNIIVHDYGNTDVEQVFKTIHNDLPGLKSRILFVREELKKTNAVLSWFSKNHHILWSKIRANSYNRRYICAQCGFPFILG